MLSCRVSRACLILILVSRFSVAAAQTSFAAPLPEEPAAQSQPRAAPPANTTKDYEFTCPGSFPSDLTIVDCQYTKLQRRQQFISTGLTDQAMLLSITGSVFTTAFRTPPEWPRTWKYYGYRVGASYTQSVGNAAAQYIVGSALHEDPRHVRCDDDPLLYRRNPSSNDTSQCTAGQRLGHALLDSITVRRSTDGVPRVNVSRDTIKNNYHRQPAWSRFAGAFAGALAQYPWEPHNSNTAGAICQRAALSFAPNFLGSFYTEYGTSIFAGLKKGRH